MGYYIQDIWFSFETEHGIAMKHNKNRQLRARRALLHLKDVPLRTRRALLLYKVNGNSALLVLNGTSLICNSALLALSLRNLEKFTWHLVTGAVSQARYHGYQT